MQRVGLMSKNSVFGSTEKRFAKKKTL